MKKESIERQIARLQSDVKKTPREAVPWIRLGNALIEAQRWDEAIEAFREALRLNPARKDAIDAHHGVGSVAGMIDRYDEAAEHLQAVVRERPEDADSRALLGTSLGQLGRFDEAEAAVKEALRLAPDLPAAHRTLGVLNMQRGRYEEAAGSLEEATRLDRYRPEPFLALGFAYMHLRRYENAEKAFREAVRIAPKSTDAWYHIGLASGVRDNAAGLAEARRTLAGLGAEEKANELLNAVQQRKTMDAALASGRVVLMTPSPEGKLIEEDITNAVTLEPGVFEIPQYVEGTVYYANVSGERRDVVWIGVSRTNPTKYVARLEVPSDIYLALNIRAADQQGLTNKARRLLLGRRWDRVKEADPKEAERQGIRTSLHYRPEMIGVPLVRDLGNGRAEIMDARPQHDTPDYLCVYVAGNPEGTIIHAPGAVST
jgi:cytochrome c-type biogenesis protein CcmH/NrfG